jgi:hypothetical protein
VRCPYYCSSPTSYSSKGYSNKSGRCCCCPDAAVLSYVIRGDPECIVAVVVSIIVEGDEVDIF